MSEDFGLSPFVYWAQSEKEIVLRVDLKNAKNVSVQLEYDQLVFKSNGIGAMGEHRYGFKLKFYTDVDPQVSQWRVMDRQVEFKIVKEVPNWWPRLVSEGQKLAWLKIDFDKWRSEDDEDDEDDELPEYPGKLNSYAEMLEKLKNEATPPESKWTWRQRYLFIYNLMQTLIFGYMFIVLVARYMESGPDSMEKTYSILGNAMKVATLLQWLEVMHPLFGYTSGSYIMAFIQVGGRNFILFLMIEFERRMQTKAVVFYLFFVWTTIEVVRYPYYLAKLRGTRSKFLTWLRYTIWIPLYPLGFLCEGVTILRNIPHFEETKRFSVALPNPWNFSFHFPTVLKIYLLLFFLPTLYTVMTHMYRQRVRYVGPQSWKKNA